MLKHALYLSASFTFAFSLSGVAHADLNINPYPQGVQPVVKDMSSAEPIDLIKLQQEPSNLVKPEPEIKAETIEVMVPLEIAPPPPPVDFLQAPQEPGVSRSGFYRSREDYLIRNGYALPNEVGVNNASSMAEATKGTPAYASTKAGERSYVRTPRRYVQPAEQELFEELEAMSSQRAEASVAVPNATPVTIAPALRWDGYSGANLKETLEVWSQKAGAELIWAHHDSAFNVRKTISASGTYEAAVQKLLEQYDNARMRPVGNLHVDSQTGSRILVIEIMQEG